jgi:hypothetical protein
MLTLLGFRDDAPLALHTEAPTLGFRLDFWIGLTTIF